MLARLLFGAVSVCLLGGMATADTMFEYSLDDGWLYEEGQPGAVSLSVNPSGGITADIDVPTGVANGGLTRSEHALPGFSFATQGFIELVYGDLSST